MALSAMILGKAVPWKWIGLAVGVLVAVGVALVFIDRAFDETEEKGAAIEQAKQLEEVIKSVETANEAREESLNRTDDQRRADCLRRSRTPENC
jgi:hypothetical protein